MSIFDNNETTASKIRGSGNRFATELWLDGRDMSSLRITGGEKDAGQSKYGQKFSHITIAFNEFEKYFSSASNIKLQLGMHTTLRIKQVQHITTESFREETIRSRQCRYPYENPGSYLSSRYGIFLKNAGNLEHNYIILKN